MAPPLLSPQRAVGLFVFGGLGGALMDQIHVQFGVLAYQVPAVFGQAIWVAPNFGLATLIMYLATVLWVRQAETAEPAPVDGRTIAREAGWFVAAYFASGLFQHATWALAAAYVLLFARRMIGRKDALWLTLHAVGLGLGGSGFESVLSSTGVFWYEHPDVAGVPVWLPGVYLHGAPLAMSVVRKLRQSQMESAVTLT